MKQIESSTDLSFFELSPAARSFRRSQIIALLMAVVMSALLLVSTFLR